MARREESWQSAHPTFHDLLADSAEAPAPPCSLQLPVRASVIAAPAVGARGARFQASTMAAQFVIKTEINAILDNFNGLLRACQISEGAKNEQERLQLQICAARLVRAE